MLSEGRISRPKKYLPPRTRMQLYGPQMKARMQQESLPYYCIEVCHLACGPVSSLRGRFHITHITTQVSWVCRPANVPLILAPRAVARGLTAHSPDGPLLLFPQESLHGLRNGISAVHGQQLPRRARKHEQKLAVVALVTNYHTWIGATALARFSSARAAAAPTLSTRATGCPGVGSNAE